MTVPPRGASRRARPRSSVDFPDAFAPTITVIRPSGMTTSRSRDDVARARSRGSGARRAARAQSRRVIRRALPGWSWPAARRGTARRSRPVTTPVGSVIGSSVLGDEVGDRTMIAPDERRGEDGPRRRPEQTSRDRARRSARRTRAVRRRRSRTRRGRPRPRSARAGWPPPAVPSAVRGVVAELERAQAVAPGRTRPGAGRPPRRAASPARRSRPDRPSRRARSSPRGRRRCPPWRSGSRRCDSMNSDTPIPIRMKR